MSHSDNDTDRAQTRTTYDPVRLGLSDTDQIGDPMDRTADPETVAAIIEDYDLDTPLGSAVDFPGDPEDTPSFANLAGQIQVDILTALELLGEQTFDDSAKLDAFQSLIHALSLTEAMTDGSEYRLTEETVEVDMGPEMVETEVTEVIVKMDGDEYRSIFNQSDDR